MLTGRQIRDARVLLRWQREGLASRTAVSPSVIDRAEASDGEPYLTMAQEIAIKHAFAKAGIEFTTDPPGVRFRPPPATLEET